MIFQSRKLPWRIHPINSLFNSLCLLALIGLLLVGTQTAVAQANQDGTITGTIHNATTDEPAAEGTVVTLHAYNSSYTSTETLTTTADADGRFQFDLTDKPSDWVYLVSTTYQDLSFSSNIAKLTAGQPLNLPITVYEPSSDPATIVIDNLHISLNFVGQEAQVSELYSVTNEGTAVFTGTSGNIDQGTLNLNLPPAAQTPTFERGMGPNSGYFPATEFIQRDGRWYDTIALRPGPNSLTLRVTYRLPLADALDLSRELPYQTNTVVVSWPDSGLNFATDGWQQQPSQSAGENGVFLSYARTGLLPDSQLALSFTGTLQSGPTGPINSSSTSDWIISLAVLLLIGTVALRLLRAKNQTSRLPQTPQLATAGPAPRLSEIDKAERGQLLVALADLDNAYKNGQLTEAAYQQQRQAIKDRLRTIWEIV